jgi:hypothetical protein
VNPLRLYVDGEASTKQGPQGMQPKVTTSIGHPERSRGSGGEHGRSVAGEIPVRLRLASLDVRSGQALRALVKALAFGVTQPV